MPVCRAWQCLGLVDPEVAQTGHANVVVEWQCRHEASGQDRASEAGRRHGVDQVDMYWPGRHEGRDETAFSVQGDPTSPTDTNKLGVRTLASFTQQRSRKSPPILRIEIRMGRGHIGLGCRHRSRIGLKLIKPVVVNPPLLGRNEPGSLAGWPVVSSRYGIRSEVDVVPRAVVPHALRAARRRLLPIRRSNRDRRCLQDHLVPTLNGARIPGEVARRPIRLLVEARTDARVERPEPMRPLSQGCNS